MENKKHFFWNTNANVLSQPLPSLNFLVIQPLVSITAIKSTIAVPEMGNWLYIHVISAWYEWLPGVLS